MSEVLVPIKDSAPSLKKNTSFGSAKDIDLHEHGEQDTLEFRVAAKSSQGKTISLWHDISLVHIDPETRNETPFYNFVCEIPKFSRQVDQILIEAVRI